MTETNIYTLAMEALAELAPEIKAAKANLSPMMPSLAEVLADLPSLPEETLFLGVAEDGLPVLLNLHDSVPGPLLITAEEGGGKTAFLQMVAQGIIDLHAKSEVRFGVVTPNPEEWKNFESSSHCTGVFPTYQNSAKDFIFTLGDWAHTNKSYETTVLLVDDLNRMTDTSQDTLDTFRWLLLRGPNRHVWPLVTLQSSKINDVQPWLDYFRTRIFGTIKNPAIVESMTNSDNSGLEALHPGSQFIMREGSDWLRFWIPRLAE